MTEWAGTSITAALTRRFLTKWFTPISKVISSLFQSATTNTSLSFTEIIWSLRRSAQDSVAMRFCGVISENTTSWIINSSVIIDKQGFIWYNNICGLSKLLHLGYSRRVKVESICRYGGIGRRAWFRSMWKQFHAGSSPVTCTKRR